MRICKQCRQSLPENAPEGLCPACLAKVALGSEPAVPGATVNVNPLAEAAPPRVAPDPAQLAAQFPQLEIIELLGVGGMGMVFKARQPRLDRFVALKILPVESQQHPSFAERFGREAKALAKLNHPGIVNIYDFGQTDQYYYFVMEYVDGMNLRHLLHNQPLEPRQALELVTQICTALQFAHDEGVVHRDIKPENILLNKKGQVKIADFGLAKLLGAAPDTALTMSQAAMGTMNYMAPEQRQNAQSVDHRADIYSLGVVFYEMLTGEVPMGRFEAPSKRVQVDVRLDEVVLKALEREPARRYQQVSEVKSSVDSINSTTPHTSPEAPAGPQTPKGATRQFPLAIKVLFTLLFIATVMGLVGARSQSDRIELLVISGGLAGLVLILYSRQQIQQARKNGLWPQLGDIPTLDHVKRLAQAGEKILAIKLYRQIHNASLADAKVAVDKLVPQPPATASLGKAPATSPGSTESPGEFEFPTPGTETAAELEAKQIRKFWGKAVGFWLLGWVLAALIWVMGPSGIVSGLLCRLAAMIGIYCLMWWTLMQRLRFIRQLSAEARRVFHIKEEGFWRRVVTGYALTGLTHLCMLVPLFAVFNAGSVAWESLNASQQMTANEFVRENAGKEHHFLRNLSAFSGTIPATELRSERVYGSFSGFEIHGWVGVALALLFGFVLLQLPPLLTFGMVRARFTWAYYWRPWLGYIGTVAGTGLLVFWGIFALSYLTYFSTDGISLPQRQTREIRCPMDLDAAVRVVGSCLRQRGYQSGEQKLFAFDAIPKGDTVAQLQLEPYQKSGPAWRLGWSGMRRVSPPLDLQFLSTTKPAETVITLNPDAGRFLSREAALEWLESADAITAAAKAQQGKL
jgi:predicted Ser/Thr protein kinase